MPKASLSIGLTGSTLWLVGDRLPHGSRADVYVDGKKVATIDTHGSTAHRHILWSKRVKQGHHVLKVVNLATKGRAHLSVTASPRPERRATLRAWPDTAIAPSPSDVRPPGSLRHQRPGRHLVVRRRHRLHPDRAAARRDRQLYGDRRRHPDSRRAQPTAFEVIAEAEKVRDDEGNHLTDITVTFRLEFPPVRPGTQRAPFCLTP